eukprot:350594-Chlamydomonas_euryale.AAC.5
MHPAGMSKQTQPTGSHTLLQQGDLERNNYYLPNRLRSTQVATKEAPRVGVPTSQTLRLRAENIVQRGGLHPSRMFSCKFNMLGVSMPRALMWRTPSSYIQPAWKCPGEAIQLP